MIKEAEQFAEEDKKVKERVDWTIFIDHLVAFTFSTITISNSSNKFFNNFELATEKSVLIGINFVFVHAQKFKIYTRNSFNEAFVRGRKLEFTEETSAHTSGGGSG